jgi:dATP pyrophosphohydrolase
MTDSHSQKSSEQQKVQVWIWCRASAEAEPRVLLLKMRKDRGGFWQPVTGSVESEDQNLEAAALREMQEETALDPLRPPKALGFEFTFPSRWGGQCRESVFEVEVRMEGDHPPRVKIDPKEHTEYQWLTAPEAKKLLHFESNVQPLLLLQKSRFEPNKKKPRDITEGLKAWLKKSIPLFVLIAANGVPAWAVQTATVIAGSASVHELPRSESPELSTFAEGDIVQVSDKPVRDRLGQSWYKVRTKEGRFGFIAVSTIEVSEIKQERVTRGIDEFGTVSGNDPAGSGWTFSVRGLALGGYRVYEEDFSFTYDAEVAFNLGWSEKGYARRRWGLGASLTSSEPIQFMAVSLIHRFFTETWSEPEVRLRVGLLAGELASGFSFGIRFPFSLVSGAHLSGYAEVSVAGAVFAPVIFGTAGAGLALHF